MLILHKETERITHYNIEINHSECVSVYSYSAHYNNPYENLLQHEEGAKLDEEQMEALNSYITDNL